MCEKVKRKLKVLFKSVSSGKVQESLWFYIYYTLDFQ